MPSNQGAEVGDIGRSLLLNPFALLSSAKSRFRYH